MALYEKLKEQWKSVEQLTPSNLKKLTAARVSDLIDAEAARSRTRLDELQQRYPSAGARELAQRTIDTKKQLASVMGGVTGVFGVVTVPIDLLGMVYLQLSLLVDVATTFKVPLKPQSAKDELLDLFGYSNGIGPVQRASPQVLGSLASLLLRRTGLPTLGRSMPLVAAPISAWLNNQHVQRVGDAAVRHYDGWVHAHNKRG